MLPPHFSSPRFARKNFRVLFILLSLAISSLISSCSSRDTSSAVYLPPGLEEFVRQQATEFLITSRLEGFRLDTVTKLTIQDIRHPLWDPHVTPSPSRSDMWCLTTVAQGKLDSTRHKVSMEWFAFREEETWQLIPRHIVAYISTWDDMCDEAERLD